MASYTSRIGAVLTAVKNCMDEVAKLNYDNIPAPNIYVGQRSFEDDETTRRILCGYDAQTEVYGPIINAWFISSSDVDDLGKSIGRTGYNDWIIKVELLGYMTANLETSPTSEMVFDALCELISDEICKNIRTNLPASSFIETFPKFVKGFSMLDTLGGVVVHRAEATFTINLCHQRGSG